MLNIIHADSARYHGAARDVTRVDLIVLHTTMGHSVQEAIEWDNRLNSSNPASYHYLVERDGVVTRTVPWTAVAWSNGNSSWPTPAPWPPGASPERWTNHRSISIALSGDLAENATLGHPTLVQVATAIELAHAVEDILHTYGVTQYSHVGHREISPGRKFDPTPGFMSCDWWRKILAATRSTHVIDRSMVSESYARAHGGFALE